MQFVTIQHWACEFYEFGVVGSGFNHTTNVHRQGLKGQTFIDVNRAIAKDHSVCPFCPYARYTGEPYLNDSTHRNTLARHTIKMFLISLVPDFIVISFQIYRELLR